MDLSMEGSGRVALLLCCSTSIAVSLSSCLSYANTSDIDCLKKLKGSLQDPLHYLTSSWVFDNVSKGSICKFVGIECWHPHENRVLNITLHGMGLKGQFPSGLENCTSLTGLDLSNNNLHGPVPHNVFPIVEYLTVLDLSSNRLSGEIPAKLGDCSYLNTLNLTNNLFTGHIPPQLGLLDRLESFNVANNLLSGSIPQFHSTLTAESFANNPGLCGPPLSECRGARQKSGVGMISWVAAGSGIITIAMVALLFYYLSCGVALMKEGDDPKGYKRVMDIRGLEDLKVTMFDNPTSKMGQSDVMKSAGSAEIQLESLTLTAVEL